MSAVPILMYHEISARPHPTYQRFTVTPDMLARQMSWLHARGYSTITLDQLMQARAGAGSLPRKPVVITFDDGCRECVVHATDILGGHGFSATFYLVAGYMGRTSEWTRARRDVALPLIDWPDARRLLAAGFSCGSHTVTHPRLAEVSVAQCRDELSRSRAILQDRLGVDVRHVAYPFGSFNDEVRRAAADAGYRTGCSIQRGLSPAADDPLALHRVEIRGNETLTDFKFRVRTARRADEVLPKPVYALARHTKWLMNLVAPGKAA